MSGSGDYTLTENYSLYKPTPQADLNAWGTHLNANADTLDGLIAAGTFPTITTGGAGGPTWTTGTGAPTATQPLGSLFSRTDGTVGATLYVSQGSGTWAAVAGV